MRLRELSYLLEKEKEFTRGQQVNWSQFKASLAASGRRFGTGDKFDSIVWLGMAGDPSGKLQGDYIKPVKLSYGKPLFGIVDAAGFFNPMTGSVTINPDSYPSWDPSETSFSATLAHELRHRGFHIASKISDIRSNLPDDVKNDIANFGLDGNKWNAEHKMLYAMEYGSAHSKLSASEARYWIGQYLKCTSVVRQWLGSFTMPKDAPAALQEELSRIYGQPVELVAPGEAPKTTAKPVVVDPDVATAAPKPKDADSRRTLLIQQGIALVKQLEPRLQKIVADEDREQLRTLFKQRKFGRILAYLNQTHGLGRGDELYEAVRRIALIQKEIKSLK